MSGGVSAGWRGRTVRCDGLRLETTETGKGEIRESVRPDGERKKNTRKTKNSMIVNRHRLNITDQIWAKTGRVYRVFNRGYHTYGYEALESFLTRIKQISRDKKKSGG